MNLDYFKNIQPLTFYFESIMKNNTKSEKRKLNFDVAYYVVKFLESLPKTIRDLFVPKTEEDLLDFELLLSNFIQKEKMRNKVMELQKEFGLPLHPNQSLREVLIKVKILTLKKQLDKKWSQDKKDDRQED